MTKISTAREITAWPYPEVEIMWKNADMTWLETCEAVYFDQLECVPPAAWKGSAFAVGEAWSCDRYGVIHAMFIQVQARYFCKMDYLYKFNFDEYEKEVINQIANERNEGATMNKKYYVTMTDKFMSGWGRAEGKINKLIIECNSFEEAQIVYDNACRRREMKYVNIVSSKPYYSASKYHVSHGGNGSYQAWFTPQLDWT